MRLSLLRPAKAERLRGGFAGPASVTPRQFLARVGLSYPISCSNRMTMNPESQICVAPNFKTPALRLQCMSALSPNIQGAFVWKLCNLNQPARKLLQPGFQKKAAT